MPVLHLVHVNLHVTDLERSIAFYEKLGWKVMFELGRRAPLEFEGGDEARAVVLSLGDDPRCATKIELMEYVRPPATPKPAQPRHEAGTHRIAMRVKDLEGTLAGLRAAGVELPDEPWEVRTMGGRQRFVLFRDPDGNLLELVELFRGGTAGA